MKFVNRCALFFVANKTSFSTWNGKSKTIFFVLGCFAQLKDNINRMKEEKSKFM